MKRIGLTVTGLFSCAAGLALWAAQIGNLSSPAAKTKSYVLYDAEQQVVPAAKRTSIDLPFKVADGFHVNSHTPKSELLIPTSLSFEPSPGVQAGPIQYPAGTSYSFSFDPAEKLDVYSGSFTIKLPVIVAAGAHTLTGTLHYQACDHAACYPPKSLPVNVELLAR